jgi:hypothetical protein
MPALVAARFNPDMKAKYAQLVANLNDESGLTKTDTLAGLSQETRILKEHNTISTRTVRRGAGQSGERFPDPEFIDGRDGCFGASSG